jgi:hypothetical protein
MSERFTVFVGNLDHRTSLQEIRDEFDRKGFKTVGFGSLLTAELEHSEKSFPVAMDGRATFSRFFRTPFSVLPS